MAVVYSGHLLKTRRQLLFQALVMMLLLLPPLFWQFTSDPGSLSLAIAALVVVPFAMVYRGWRFLGDQERAHAAPTPEMTFVFGLVAAFSMVMTIFLMILLSAI